MNLKYMSILTRTYLEKCNAKKQSRIVKTTSISTTEFFSDLRTTIVTETTGPRLNIKTIFPRYGDSHVKDKTVVRPSYI